jgi:hypothetical protein
MWVVCDNGKSLNQEETLTTLSLIRHLSWRSTLWSESQRSSPSIVGDRAADRFGRAYAIGRVRSSKVSKPFCHHGLSTYLIHCVSACYFCHQFRLVRPLVISPIGLDSVLTSSHRSILLGLLCLLAFIGTGTGALSMGVYHVSISPT